MVRAFAKINLILDVLGKREDGYHEIASVMQSLALCDYITFEEAQDLVLTVEGETVPAGPENLIYRAAEALRDFSGEAGRGAAIHLEKHIPVAAGLGGGSADAAATLLGLNELWRLGLSRAELMTVAAGLGADVPFCLVGGTGLVRGKGEIVTPLPPAPAMGVVLAVPPLGVSTAEVYARFDATPVRKRPDTEAMVRALRAGKVKEVAARLGNVLEAVTFAMHPELRELKQAVLDAGALGALMSGSGPVVFGLTPDAPGARKVAARLTANGIRTLVTST
ncbi:MAG: 4-(cytidine 5'-diphospho)-2-C-methyl-D-erythritol kinase [Desulfotomaculales bacterium]